MDTLMFVFIRLQSESYAVPMCNSSGSKDTFLQGDYSSSAQFFVCVGVFGFLYCTATLILYLGYQSVYRQNTRGPIVVSRALSPKPQMCERETPEDKGALFRLLPRQQKVETTAEVNGLKPAHSHPSPGDQSRNQTQGGSGTQIQRDEEENSSSSLHLHCPPEERRNLATVGARRPHRVGSRCKNLKQTRFPGALSQSFISNVRHSKASTPRTSTNYRGQM